jgi:hypothetical protein
MASFGLHITQELVEDGYITNWMCNIMRNPQFMHLSQEEIRAMDYEVIKGSFQPAYYPAVAPSRLYEEIRPITGTANYHVSKP